MNRSMNRFYHFAVITILFTMVLSGLNIINPFNDPILINGVDGALDVSDPIVIEGNAGLLTHSSVRSGSGATLDPYIISDYSINAVSSGRHGLVIRNTTAHLLIRNLTVQVSSSAIGVYLYPLYSGGWKAMNLIIENITVTGGSTQVYMYVPTQVIIKDSTFNNPSTSGDVFYCYYGSRTYISNNTINCPNMDVDLDYTSSFGFTDNHGSIRRYDHLRFRYSNFANNTLSLYSAKLYSGYFSDFQGNVLTGRSSSENLVQIIDCNRIKIANNTIQGGRDSIYVTHPNTYTPVRTNYPKWASLRFEFNHINGSANRGIYFYYTTGHPAMTYMNIVFNRFTNCTLMAIEVLGGGSPTTNIWHNIFENNHGSGDTFSAGTAQARDRYGQFSWDNGVMGNYWKDKRQPDDDNDGFVDEIYPQDSFSSSSDNFPVSNPYFDFESPFLQIIEPSGRFYDHSYLNLSWNVKDNLSGMRKMEIRYGFQPWIDVTGNDHYGLYLVQGQYKLTFKATDQAFLQTEIAFDIDITRTLLPFMILSPLEGEFFNGTSLNVAWSLREGFVPYNVSFSLDGAAFIDLSSLSSFQIDTFEGEHELNVRFYDHYGYSLSKVIPFTCDITDPVVNIKYPAQGSVISNDLVNFKWESSDEFGISTMLVKIDDGPLIEKSNNYFSELLSDGPHTVQVIVIDNAGNTEEDILSFVVSVNTSLNIISPRLIDPTSAQYHTVKWEYLTANLEIASLSLILDNENPLELSNSALQHELFLSNEGRHTITVKAFDPVGNVVSDTVEVILDRTAPSPGFQYPQDGAYLNQTNLDLKWNAIEKWGLDHFDIYVDNILKGSGLKQGSFSLDILPGPHVIKVLAVDNAGNIGEDQITVTIDIDHPGLKLIEPSLDILTDVYVTFRWEGDDEFGIDHYNFTLDSKPVEELGLATSRQLSMTEGEHVFTLHCMDLAGNVRSITKRFTLDLNDPLVTFVTELPEFVDSFNGLIEWNIVEEVGVEKIDLTIDGIEYQVSPDARYFTNDLNKGRHEIHIVVTDISGRVDDEFLVFTIDADAPAVLKGAEDVVVDGAKATIYWILGEEKSNLTGSLTLDGHLVNMGFDLEDGSFLFAELSVGNHTAVMQLMDQAGNEKEVTWDFIIEEEKISGPGSSGASAGIIFLIVIIILIVIGASLGFYYHKNRKPKEEEKKIEAPKRPDKLTFGPKQIHPVKAPAPHHHHQHQQVKKAPPIHAAGSTSGQDVGHGYIRPESKKAPVKRKIIDIPDQDVKHEIKEERRKPEPHQPQNEVQENVDEWGDVEDWEEVDEVEEWDDMEEL